MLAATRTPELNHPVHPPGRCASMNRRGGVLLLAFVAILPAVHAQSGKWPERPVRMMSLPTGRQSRRGRAPAGAETTEEFGQQFVVDNRAGAGGTIGAEIAVRANPDGYTVAVVPSSYATSAALYKLP